MGEDHNKGLTTEAPLISVVIPVYNIEDFLPWCVQSVMDQTYRNLEILLVDDGSSDRSGAICDDYAEKDERIAVLHKRNGGLSDARNDGIEMATGTLITFVDGDDYLAGSCIEEMVFAMESVGADVSVVGCEMVEAFSVPSAVQKAGPVKSMDKQEAMKRVLDNSLMPNAWGKLYKAELFRDIRFPVGAVYEDLASIFLLFDKAETLALLDAPLYRYVVRTGSIMHSEFNPRKYESLAYIDEAVDFVRERYPALCTEAEGKRVYTYFTVLKQMMEAGDRDRYREEIGELKRRISLHAKRLLSSKKIKMTWKLRLLALRMGERPYLLMEKLFYKMIDRRVRR